MSVPKTRFAETIEGARDTVEYWRERAALEAEELGIAQTEIAALKAEVARLTKLLQEVDECAKSNRERCNLKWCPADLVRPALAEYEESRKSGQESA